MRLSHLISEWKNGGRRGSDDGKRQRQRQIHGDGKEEGRTERRGHLRFFPSITIIDHPPHSRVCLAIALHCIAICSFHSTIGVVATVYSCHCWGHFSCFAAHIHIHSGRDRSCTLLHLHICVSVSPRHRHRYKPTSLQTRTKGKQATVRARISSGSSRSQGLHWI